MHKLIQTKMWPFQWDHNDCMEQLKMQNLACKKKGINFMPTVIIYKEYQTSNIIASSLTYTFVCRRLRVCAVKSTYITNNEAFVGF